MKLTFKQLLLVASGVLFMLVMFASCELFPVFRSGVLYITFRNNAGIPVVVGEDLRSLKSLNADTVIPCHFIDLHQIDAESVGLLQYLFHEMPGWDRILNDTIFLDLYVMDEKCFSRWHCQGCDSIKKNVPILHNYRLTREDLKKLNWTIHYPPTEAEKQIADSHHLKSDSIDRKVP